MEGIQNTQKTVSISELIEQNKEKNNNVPVREAQANLGKDDFLKLLVTQLKHQDPSNPVKDQNFIAQMAQFSSLEQMQNISQSIDRLSNRQSYSLIGQYVKGVDFTSKEALEGTVQAVFFDSNKQAFLRVSGKVMKLADLHTIEKNVSIDKPQQNSEQTQSTKNNTTTSIQANEERKSDTKK